MVYYLNYSRDEQKFTYSHKDGRELFTKADIKKGDFFTVKPWNLSIVEEK